MPGTEDQDPRISTLKSALEDGKNGYSDFQLYEIYQDDAKHHTSLSCSHRRRSLCNAIHDNDSILVTDLPLQFLGRILRLPPKHISEYLTEKSRP
jgi:hypothetical protein